jgi:hypothetical protein
VAPASVDDFDSDFAFESLELVELVELSVVGAKMDRVV